MLYRVHICHEPFLAQYTPAAYFFATATKLPWKPDCGININLFNINLSLYFPRSIFALLLELICHDNHSNTSIMPFLSGIEFEFGMKLP